MTNTLTASVLTVAVQMQQKQVEHCFMHSCCVSSTHVLWVCLFVISDQSPLSHQSVRTVCFSVVRSFQC